VLPHPPPFLSRGGIRKGWAGREGGKGGIPHPVREGGGGGDPKREGRNPGGPFFSHPSIEPIPMVHPTPRPMGQRIHTQGREGEVNPTPRKERSHEPPRTMPKEKELYQEGGRRGIGDTVHRMDLAMDGNGGTSTRAGDRDERVRPAMRWRAPKHFKVDHTRPICAILYPRPNRK